MPTERRAPLRTRPPSFRPALRPVVIEPQSFADRFLPPLFFGFLILAFLGSAAMLLWAPSSQSDHGLTEEELRTLSGAVTARPSSPEALGSTGRAQVTSTTSSEEAGSAVLHVTTVPSGAVVSIDGEVAGVTPLRRRGLPSRWHIVSVESSDFGSRDTLVYLEEGAPTSVALTLGPSEEGGAAASPPAPVAEEPAARPEPPARAETPASPPRSAPTSGSIRVRVTPTDVPMQFNGRTVGVAPLDLGDVPAGTHTLTFFLPGYETATVQVNVEPGAREVVNVALVPQKGILSVVVRPWGSVYVDGVLRASDTDVSVEVELPAGRHEVRVEHPTLGTRERTVEVQPQTTTSAVFDLN